MGNRNLHIGNLKLRLPRSAAGSARQIAAELGRAILQNAAEATRGRRGTVRMEELTAGRITVASEADPLSLRKQISARVAAELEKRLV